MDTATRDELLNALDAYLCRVHDDGNRVIVKRAGQAVAALIPIGDLELLMAVEDRLDRTEIEAALRESESEGYFAWDDVKAELGH